METKKHKVTIMQGGGTEAIFRLSDKELNMLRMSSIFTMGEAEQAKRANYGRCYNFAMFTFFDHQTTRSKANRFRSIFDYHKGDFTWFCE